MKRFICMVAALLCLFTVFATAANAGAQVMIDGSMLPQTAYVSDGVSFIPLRAFCEALGFTVSWNGNDRSVLLKGGADKVWMQSGNAYADKNGVSVSLGAKCRLINGSFYAPARGLAKLFSLDVDWDGRARRVLFKYSRQNGQYNETDLYWLSRIINAEAQGEPLEGKIAVGNVILNRVRRTDFPDTIYDVIFDTKYGVQFTPTAIGTIYNTPTEESVAAAKMCLDGEVTAKDCLYFFNPELSSLHGWIVNNRNYCKTIGNHRFYY